MTMDTVLSVIGGIVLVSGVFAYYLDNRRPSQAVTIEGLIRFLGIVGVIALFCVVFGLVSWLISAIYWNVIVRAAALLGWS